MKTDELTTSTKIEKSTAEYHARIATFTRWIENQPDCAIWRVDPDADAPGWDANQRWRYVHTVYVVPKALGYEVRAALTELSELQTAACVARDRDTPPKTLLLPHYVDDAIAVDIHFGGTWASRLEPITVWTERFERYLAQSVAQKDLILDHLQALARIDDSHVRVRRPSIYRKATFHVAGARPQVLTLRKQGTFVIGDNVLVQRARPRFERNDQVDVAPLFAWKRALLYDPQKWDAAASTIGTHNRRIAPSALAALAGSF